jgi:hypothetical protein
MLILFSFSALIAFILIRALSLEKISKIERSITVDCRPGEVFSYIQFLKNHRLFNKWTMTDPALDITYQGEDGTAGFSSHWKSQIKNVGEGYQTITTILPDQRIDYDLRFVKPFAGVAKAYLKTQEITSGTKVSTLVTWGFTSERNFMAKLMQAVLNLENMLGKDLEISLKTLKNNLEKKQDA